MVNGINEITYVKKNCVMFNSYCRNENVVLSNLYDKCNIKFEGMTFHSSEQLFFYLLLEDCEEGRNKIMSCQTAKECKKIGSRYLKKMGWDDSNEVCQRAEVQALRFAIGLKMRYCEEFRNLVLNSGNKKIVEYAWWGDNDYGVVDLDEKNKFNYYKGEVRGRNICGRLIMEWRKKYREHLN